MILVDLNVLFDVVQKREPHYRASAAVLSEVVSGRVSAILPAHAFTTLYYIVERYQNRARANEVVDWLLRYFDIAPIGRDELLGARELNWSDFEDAVVAESARTANCHAIVTRNITDFPDSIVPVLTPHEYLLEIETGTG